MAKEMDDSQAFLFYAEKFYSGTADMLPETVGIYIRLLSKLWNMPDGLPKDIKKLARLSLVSERKFNQCWHNDMLSEKFFENSVGGLTNDRLEIVRAKRLAKSIKAKESAEKRWKETDANALPTQSERNANGMHISKDKISEVKINKEIDTNVSTKKVRVMLDDVKAMVEQALPKLIFTEKFTQASKKYFAEWSLTGKKLTDLKTKIDIGKYMQKQIGYLHKKYSPSQIEFILERCSRLEWVGLNDDDKVPEPKPLAVEVPQEIYSNLPIVPKTTLEDIDTLPDIFKTND